MIAAGPTSERTYPVPKKKQEPIIPPRAISSMWRGFRVLANAITLPPKIVTQST